MLADYLEAAIPTPSRILGQELKPFCLGHLFILQRIENAFVTEGKSPALGDLLTGVFICCHTYEEALGALQSVTPAMIKKWGKSIGIFDLNEKAREFLGYIIAGSRQPRVIPPDGSKLEGVRTPGAPFLQQMYLTLVSDLHVQDSAAMNMPLGKAFHDFYAYYERKGSIEIYGPDEKTREETVRAVLGEIARELGITIEELKRRQREAGDV